MFIYTYKLTLKLRFFFFNKYVPQYWTSLVAQWSRIHLPVQERWVQSLGWEANGNTLLFLPGKFQGQRNLVGYGQRGH